MRVAQGGDRAACCGARSVRQRRLAERVLELKLVSNSRVISGCRGRQGSRSCQTTKRSIFGRSASVVRLRSRLAAARKADRPAKCRLHAAPPTQETACRRGRNAHERISVPVFLVARRQHAAVGEDLPPAARSQTNRPQDDQHRHQRGRLLRNKTPADTATTIPTRHTCKWISEISVGRLQRSQPCQVRQSTEREHLPATRESRAARQRLGRLIHL